MIVVSKRCSCATRHARDHQCAWGSHLLQQVGDESVQQDAERVRVAQQLPQVAVRDGPAAPRLRHRLQCAAAMAQF